MVFAVDVEHIVGIYGNVCYRDISVVGGDADIAGIHDVRLVGQEKFEVVEVEVITPRQHNFCVGRNAVFVVIKTVGAKPEIRRRAGCDGIRGVADIETQDATIRLQRVYLDEAQLFRNHAGNYSVHHLEFLHHGIQFVFHRNPCRIHYEILTVFAAEFGVEVDGKMRLFNF